jgi:hypothetical protein
MQRGDEPLLFHIPAVTQISSFGRQLMERVFFLFNPA